MEQEAFFKDGQTPDGNDQQQTAANELDKLYDRLPLLIARLRNDAVDNELLTSLRRLFKDFDKINELEVEAMTPEERGVYKELNFTRLYEMAVNGGGGDVVEELKAANAAFAEENAILTETIEGLSFQITTLKRDMADQKIGDDMKYSPQDIKKSLAQVTGVVEQTQKLLARIGGASAEEAPDKGLDERFLEAISGFDDITPDLLKTAPASTTVFGRMLRRVGIAYDYKDLAAVRRLVAGVLKTNKKLANVQIYLSSLQESMGAVHKLVGIAELYAGHEERQGPQYKEAMEEVARLRGIIERYESRQGTLDELDGKIQEREETIERMDEEIEARGDIISHLKEREQEQKQKTFEAARQARQRETQAQGGQVQAHSQFEADSQPSEESLKTIARLERQVAQLKLQLERTAQESAEKIKAADKRTEQAVIDSKKKVALVQAETRERIRQSKNGLLVEKLEHELHAARAVAATADEKVQMAQEETKAFQNRVEIWVASDEQKNKEITSWKKKAALKWSFAAAAVAATGFLGYSLAGLVQASPSFSVGHHFGIMIGVPAALGLFFGFICGERDERIKTALGGCAIVGVIGGVFGVLSLKSSDTMAEKLSSAKQAALQVEYDKFFSAHAGFVKPGEKSPYFVMRDENGHYNGKLLIDEYKGKIVTLDLTKPDQPVMVVSESVTLLPQRPPEAQPGVGSSEPVQPR